MCEFSFSFQSPASALNLLTDKETDAILQSAKGCVASECSVDEVSGLVYELQEQKHVLQSRLDQISFAIEQLQHLNQQETDVRSTDEIKALVKDMMRVFSTDKPFVFPTGFAGEIGNGPTTAYDCLEPKPWKKPSVSP